MTTHVCSECALRAATRAALEAERISRALLSEERARALTTTDRTQP